MKKLNFFGKYLLPFLIPVVIFCACDKDDSTPSLPDYVGTWVKTDNTDSMIITKDKLDDFLLSYDNATGTYIPYFRFIADINVTSDSIMNISITYAGVSTVDDSGNPTGNIEMIDESNPKFEETIKQFFSDITWQIIYLVTGEKMYGKWDWDNNGIYDSWEIEEYDKR